MLFADDVAIAAHSPSQLQSLMDRFANACTDFGLIISLKKTKVLAQAISSPKITIKNYELEVVEYFIYLGSTITSKLSLEKGVRQTNWYGSICIFPLQYTCVEKSPTVDKAQSDCV